MSTRKKIMAVLAGVMLISLIAACQKSPAAATVLPAKTPLPSTVTVSMNTPTAVNTVEVLTSTPPDLSGLVSGTPVPDWQGIPVMPGASAGNLTDTGYIYSTTATPPEVAIFYTQELSKLGWAPKPDNGTPQPGGVLILEFSNGQDTCLVAIIQQQVGTLVMLGMQPK